MVNYLQLPLLAEERTLYGGEVGIGTLDLEMVLVRFLLVSSLQNTLILDEIQGSFITGVGTIRFDNGTNVVAGGAGVTFTHTILIQLMMDFTLE